MISFSGIDCSGKSTQLEIVKKYYEEKGVKCKVIWSRGGYTPWVEKVKTILRKDKKYNQEQKDEYRAEFNQNLKKQKLLLWASIADLIRYYGIVYRFIELSGTLILCDRYIWDTYIDFKLKYPKLQFEKWFIWKIMLKTIKKPKHSIIFTIPVEVSMKRSIEKNDPHSEPYEVRMERIHKYEEQIALNRWQYVIDAQVPIKEVTAKVMKIIED